MGAKGQERQGSVVSTYPAERKRLNPQLRNVIREHIGRRHIKSWMMAEAGGFAPAVFSRLLYVKRIPCTALTVSRFARIADFVGFDGPVFVDDEEGAR
jgi:hypothetical protein